jgi:hypothetical protein
VCYPTAGVVALGSFVRAILYGEVVFPTDGNHWPLETLTVGGPHSEGRSVDLVREGQQDCYIRVRGMDPRGRYSYFEFYRLDTQYPPCYAQQICWRPDASD